MIFGNQPRFFDHVALIVRVYLAQLCGQLVMLRDNLSRDNGFGGVC